MDPVVHFEMPYDDSGRVAKFYQAAFGWKMKLMGEQMGHYVLAATGETSADGMIKKPGMINGGFFPKKPEWPAQPSVVLQVKDIRKAMDKVASAGGKVLGDPMPIPGIGDYVSFTDTEGNRVGMLEPVPMKKVAAKKPAAKKAPARKQAPKKKASRKR